MSLILSIMYPIFEFIDRYKWYFIIGIGLYIILTVAFRWARQAITVVFGILLIFFCLSHLPHMYNALTGLSVDLTKSSEAATDVYVDYVSDNILSDDSLTPGEKLDKSIRYGLSGKEDDSKYQLPTSKDMSLKETLDYVANSTKWGAGADGDGDPGPGIVDPVPDDVSGFEKFAEGAKAFGKMIWDEMKALVT